ncbi:MAG: outer membrane protein assembly factor BamE [Nitrospirales bacterium]|nr:outer membrane protein assembly factor BamE [Nitrospirales bacterium]
MGALLFFAALSAGCSSAPVRFTHDEIKGYPLDVQERIIKGEVTLGMTQQQVRYTWGSPTTVKTSAARDGRQREEWIYSDTVGYKRRLLFVDGRLADITEGLFLKSGQPEIQRQETK